MRLKKPSIQKLRKQYENNNDIETTRIVMKTTTAKDQQLCFYGDKFNGVWC